MLTHLGVEPPDHDLRGFQALQRHDLQQGQGVPSNTLSNILDQTFPGPPLNKTDPDMGYYGKFTQINQPKSHTKMN